MELSAVEKIEEWLRQSCRKLRFVGPNEERYEADYHAWAVLAKDGADALSLQERRLTEDSDLRNAAEWALQWIEAGHAAPMAWLTPRNFSPATRPLPDEFKKGQA